MNLRLHRLTYSLVGSILLLVTPDSITASTVVAWGDNVFGQTNLPPGLSNVVAVAAGNAHSLALMSDGTVIAWGANYDHQTDVPPGLTNVTVIAAGYSHSLALKSDGTVVAWGGWNGSPLWPVPVGLTNVVAIAGQGPYSLAVMSDGTVVTWGASSHTNYPSGLSNIVNVAGGLALQADGTVVVWRNYPWGQTNVPAGLTNVTAIAGGDNHSLALVGSGPPLLSLLPNRVAAMDTTVRLQLAVTGSWPLTYQWRFNGVDLLGATNTVLVLTNLLPAEAGLYSLFVRSPLGEVTSSDAQLTVVPVLASVPPQSQLVWKGATVNFSVSVQSSQPVHYQWRFNGTDLANKTNSVLTLTNAQFQQSGRYSVQLATSWGEITSPEASLSVGLVAAWGKNDYGQTNTPPGLTNVVAISAGGNISLAINADGTVTAWGDNPHGLLAVPLGLSNLEVVAIGEKHCLALKCDGTVTAWGDNSFGQTNVPLGLPSVVAIAAGNAHCLALQGNGNIVAWGDNSFRQTNAPSGLSNVVAIAAAGNHSLALKANGTVVAWGDNSSGQTSVPFGLSNVTAIAAGRRHSLALRQQGTVVPWGGSSQASLPSNLSNVVAIAAGDYHCLALKADGTVVAWPLIAYGQTEVPSGLSNVVAIAAGALHSLALCDSGAHPQLLQPTFRNQHFSASFWSLPRKTYRFEFADSLPPTNWIPLSSFPGIGTRKQLTDTNTAQLHRFYRLRTE